MCRRRAVVTVLNSVRPTAEVDQPKEAKDQRRGEWLEVYKDKEPGVRTR